MEHKALVTNVCSNCGLRTTVWYLQIKDGRGLQLCASCMADFLGAFILEMDYEEIEKIVD